MCLRLFEQRLFKNHPLEGLCSYQSMKALATLVPPFHLSSCQENFAPLASLPGYEVDQIRIFRIGNKGFMIMFDREY